MIRGLLDGQEHILWVALAMLVFIVAFIAMLLWIYRPGSRRLYQRTARLPLEDDKPADKDNQSSSQGDTHAQGT